MEMWKEWGAQMRWRQLHSHSHAIAAPGQTVPALLIPPMPERPFESAQWIYAQSYRPCDRMWCAESQVSWW